MPASDFETNQDGFKTDDHRVHDGRELAQLRTSFLDTSLPLEGVGFETYLERLRSHVFVGSANLRSPLSVGHMTGTPHKFYQRLAADIVALNQNMVKFEASRALTMLERQVLGVLHRATFRESEQFYRNYVQDCKSALGVFTSGGTLANITALWVARDRALGCTTHFPGISSEGLCPALLAHGYKSAVIVGSELAHYSFQKAAGVLGLGTHGFVEVPVSAERRIDTDALQHVLDEQDAAGACVLAIVGIGGTTDCGSIDPLSDLANVAEERGIFFHVDAAWGFPLLFSRKHARKLEGIERADSVSIDGHKQFHIPVGSSILLFRRPSEAHVIEQTANYMLQDASGDLGKFTMEGSRPCAVVFWDAALRVIGSRQYGVLAEESIRKAKHFAEMIAIRDEFELVLEPQTNIVLYRYLPPGLRNRANGEVGGGGTGRRAADEEALINACTERVHLAQSAAGRSYVSRTRIRKRGTSDTPVTALRAVILNPNTAEHHLRSVLDEQSVLGSQIWPAMGRSLSFRNGG
jgi:putative pyridoxal-dependent aspartate 1-decarboxylase